MKTKENKIRELWKHARTNFTIVIAVLFVAMVYIATVSATTNLQTSPAQNAIKQAIANGNFSANDIEGNPEYSVEILEQNESHIKFRANTRIIFKNPKGAGYGNNGWPKFEINKTEGNLKAGNYDERIKDSILSELKNIKDEDEKSKKLKAWNNYDFEKGSRIYEISEIYEATYPNESALKSAVTKILPDDNNNILPSNIFNNYVLMGFTNNVHWTYSRQENLYLNIIFGKILIAWARVDALLDAVLGLRLPTIVGLDTPNIMVRGQSYTLNTNINGQDWDAATYSAANVPSENGNEFIARGQASITIQAWARIIGDIGPYSIYNRGFDYSRSFQTPFGPYQEFPIPDLYLSPDQTGLKIYCCANLLWGGIGLKIDPNLGSDKITANWNAGGDSIGSGPTEYNMPNANYYFGPVIANDYSTTTDYANIRLSDYKYYFTICSLTLGANLQGGLTFLPLTIQTGYIDFYTRNCADITGGHYLGIHQGTTASGVTGYSLVKNYITMTSPNGGENWIRGTTNTITWTSIDNAGNVKIELFKGGNVDKLITSSTPNSGSYGWSISPMQTLGSDYRIRITSTSNPSYTDISDNNFIIGDTYINILKNPGFEIAYGSVPMYWNKYQTGTRAIFTYPEVGRTGTGKSVAIKYLSRETGKVALWRQTGISVVPSKQYKLSGYMKLSGVSGGPGSTTRPGGGSIRVTWVRSDGGIIRTDVINKVGTIGWTKYEKIFMAPSNAVRATVGGDLFDSSGKVWFDDMSLVRVS